MSIYYYMRFFCFPTSVYVMPIMTFSSMFMHFTMYSTSYRFSCSDKDLFYAGVVPKPFPPVFDHVRYTYHKSSRLEVEWPGNEAIGD